MPDTRALLSSGLTELNLDFSSEQLQQLLDYIALMQKWNGTHNLTTIKTEEDIATLHFLDSLSIADWIIGNTILDVGAGAGLPSIPLAIACPEKHFTLVDSSSKRVAFLQTVKASLNLNNVAAIHSRIEDLQSRAFEHIVSRAFSSLKQFVESSHHVLGDNGNWLAMKGQHPTEELAELDSKMTAEAIELSVPGLDAERYLVVIKQIS